MKADKIGMGCTHIIEYRVIHHTSTMEVYTDLLLKPRSADYTDVLVQSPSLY